MDSKNIECYACHTTLTIDIPTDATGVPNDSVLVSCPSCKLHWTQELIAWYGRLEGWRHRLGTKKYHFHMNGMALCRCITDSHGKSAIPKKPTEADMCKACLSKVKVRIKWGELPENTWVGSAKPPELKERIATPSEGPGLAIVSVDNKHVCFTLLDKTSGGKEKPRGVGMCQVEVQVGKADPSSNYWADYPFFRNGDDGWQDIGNYLWKALCFTTSLCHISLPSPYRSAGQLCTIKAKWIMNRGDASPESVLKCVIGP